MSAKDINAPQVPGVYPVMVDETKKLSFWVSQVFILLATVVGVYLASSQGFKQALAYGEIQSAKTNYYLRKSLRDEIADNIPLIQEYATGVASGSSSARSQPINLDTFVWDCLVSSPSTLETPPELLRESRKFYREVEDTRKKIIDTYYTITMGKERLDAAVSHMEKDILPKFDADLQALNKLLKANGVEVD